MLSGDCNICINGKMPSYSATCVECGLSRKNYKSATNYDLIISKTPEDLAKWLDCIRLCCDNDLCGRSCPLAEVCYSTGVTKEMIDWLKGPVEVDNG